MLSACHADSAPVPLDGRATTAPRPRGVQRWADVTRRRARSCWSGLPTARLRSKTSIKCIIKEMAPVATPSLCSWKKPGAPSRPQTTELAREGQPTSLTPHQPWPAPPRPALIQPSAPPGSAHQRGTLPQPSEHAPRRPTHLPQQGARDPATALSACGRRSALHDRLTALPNPQRPWLSPLSSRVGVPSPAWRPSPEAHRTAPAATAPTKNPRLG